MKVELPVVLYPSEVLNAIRDGVSEAFVAMVRNGTDMPTADILEMIRQGVKDAMAEHLSVGSGDGEVK